MFFDLQQVKQVYQVQWQSLGHVDFLDFKSVEIKRSERPLLVNSVTVKQDGTLALGTGGLNGPEGYTGFEYI